MAADSPTRKARSMSPTAEALQALKSLSSPTASQAPDEASDRLRIQAPSSSSGTLSSGTLVSGPSSISPASGLSAPTSPADDGLDTPDSEASKRPRLADGATPPLFLEKTFEMLDKCAPRVACWSAGGDSFIVKNPVAFAEHVIPVYFKHKNFSSFVRQLNFYGFRKVRVVDPEITGGVDPKDWWEFRHEKFLRGRKDLLREIKRRSLPSAAGGGSGDGTGRSVIDRAEIEELRTEVCTLREQIQTLNKHMFSVMQIMMTRAAPPPGATPVAFPSPHYAPPPYAFAPGLPPPHPSMLGAVANKNDKRGAASPSTGSSGYALRPIQTFVGSGVPPGYPFPLTPSGDPTVDWEAYSRHAFHAAHGHPPQTPSGVAPMPVPNVPPSSSVPAVPGLKRTRSQQQKRSPSATSAAPTGTALSAPVNPVENPEAAVRHLSLLVSQIRMDLLQSILSRTLAFIRAQPSSSASSDKALQNPEIEAVAETVASDIQQRMVQVNEAEAATHGRPRGSAPSETSHMYRVEMLKFVSKELPRAMSEAVEKRLPPSTKKTLNRSLLALMVQKAQAALENQMRQETANSTAN